MVTDAQVRKLRSLLANGKTLALAARKTGMDEKTARKYRDMESLPSQTKRPRSWRTRVDPFAEVWPEVQRRLEQEPRLRPVTLFGWLQEKYPGRFPDSQRRTFERRVRHWRSTQGPRQEVFFPQVHPPGVLAASDFTSMNSLRVTIGGQSFDHLLYHCTLTYSNWESVAICFSESFEAFSRGIQDAFWEMGGVPSKHRSDSLSAAVNNLSEDREFRSRYQELMTHYGVEAETINPRKAHENGDVESSHGHLKTAIDQALLLRGSRDFSDRGEYEEFLRQLIERRNQGRRDRFAEEQALLGELPPSRLDHVRRERGIKVRRSSTIQVKRNTYSVPSRLIGQRVDAVIDVEHVEVWHAGTLIQQMPRLAGSGKHAINYRHVIDSLVRKPGAFENYQYHADLFPTSHFRIAYDSLCRDHRKRVAVREYLKILQLAARDSQDAVQDALRLAINNGEAIHFESVRQAVESHQQAPTPTDVEIEPPNLSCFDSLLQHPDDMEVDRHEFPNIQIPSTSHETVDDQQRCRSKSEAEADREVDSETKRRVDSAVSGSSPADVPGTFPGNGTTGGGGIVESHGVPGGADRAGMPSPSRKPDISADESFAIGLVEAVGQLRLDASSAASDASNGEPARRILPESPGELADLWQARFWEVALPMCIGRATGSARSFDSVHHVQLVSAATSDRQTGLAIAEADQEAVGLRGSDHRRLGLCPAEPRRNGSPVHVACRTLRAWECDADEQPTLQQVGADLQRCHDDRGGDRPTSSSQRDLGVERTQLPPGEGQDTARQVSAINVSRPEKVTPANLAEFLIVANEDR
jgi:hypothetical protein